MKLIIFGATGSVGRHLVEQALQAQHQVTAFVRDPSRVSVLHPNLELIQGNVLDPAHVQRAISNHDAALCVLGGGRKGTVRSRGTKNIVDAMQSNGTRRFICETSLGVGDSAGNLNFFWRHIMFGWFLREAYHDHHLQEDYVMRSNLDWTIVRPGAFTIGPRTGVYRHGFSPTDKTTKLKISRADVADFMLKQLDTKAYWKMTPGLSY